MQVQQKVLGALQQEMLEAGHAPGSVESYASASRTGINAAANKTAVLRTFFNKYLSSSSAWDSLWEDGESFIGSAAQSEFDGDLLDRLSTGREKAKSIDASSTEGELFFVVLLVLSNTYVLDKSESRFGNVRDRAASLSLQQVFRLPKRIASRSMWTESVLASVFGGKSADPSEAVSHEEYERLIDAYAGRTANSRQHQPGDTRDKEELGNTAGLFEEIQIATNVFVLNKAKRSLSKMDWLPTKGGNMCCLARSIIMMVAINSDWYGENIDSRVTELKEELGTEGLTPEQQRERFQELGSRTDLTGRVIGMLNFLRTSAKTMQNLIESNRSIGTVNFTHLLAASVLPLATQAIDDIYERFEDSPAGSLDNYEWFKKLRKGIKDKVSIVKRDSDATNTELAEIFYDQEIEDDITTVILKCGPAMDILDNIVFPIVDGTKRLLQEILYILYTHIIERAKFEKDFSDLTFVRDRVAFLDVFIKWMEENLDPILRNPSLCVSVDPTDKDIENFVNFALDSNEFMLGEDIGIQTGAFLRHALDPNGFDRRLSELEDKMNRSSREDEELSSLKAVRLVWAI